MRYSMAPDIGLNFIIKNEKNQEYDLEEVINKDVSTNDEFYHRIVIPNLIYHLAVHVGAVIGVYHLLIHAKFFTFLWWVFLGFTTGETIALGAHRYYSHKSFKATTTIRVLLLLFQLIAGQNSMYTWARDHRQHHKYSDTDADPHNAKRGLFFSHIGWLLTRKHPLVKEKAKCIDVSDLLEEKLLMFQHKHFVPLYLLLGFFLPTYIPVLAWNENWWTSFWVTHCLRYVIILHLTWSINSLAHMLGTRPYDKRLVAVDSVLVANISGGDGWHNYHHAFPWDASVGEFGIRGGFNTKLLYKLRDYGFVYDLKAAGDSVVEGHTKRHGDGSHPFIEVEKKTEENNENEKPHIRNGLQEKIVKIN